MRPRTALARAVALHRAAFGAAPALASSAPGRVNLIGEHVDYNGGPVLPLAIGRRTVAAVAPASGFRAVSAELGDGGELDLAHPGRGRWSDYLAGVVHELRERGLAPAGATIAVASDVPAGAGLSSSAALTVAVAHALARLAGRRPTRAGLVDVAYHAEHDRVGVRCGRMDQTIAVHARAGTALHFETASGDLAHVPFTAPLVVVETGVHHALRDGELNRRRAECEAALAALRAAEPALPSLAAIPATRLAAALARLAAPLDARVRHVVTETARTRDAVAALRAGDLPALGALLVAGHRSLAADYAASCAEADAVVAAALAHGALGARLTGAGFGGAVLVLPAPGEARRLLRALPRALAGALGGVPRAWIARASAGVRREAAG